MVLKLCRYLLCKCGAFESSVNSDGTQTVDVSSFSSSVFESSVNSDGTQTYHPSHNLIYLFESSVNSDGTQTIYRKSV